MVLALTASNMVFSMATVQDNYLELEVDENTFAFDLGTSFTYAPVPNADLLYGYEDGGPWSTFATVKVDNMVYDLTSVTVSTPLATGATFIQGAKKIGDITVTCNWALVVNPATGTLNQLDTAEFKYTLTNTNGVTAHNVALRLELDTKVIVNDGTNISVDNGFNVITQNTVYYKSLNQIPSNWWDYDVSPLLDTPLLVGRGYNKNNNPAYDDPAVEPDIMEIANWSQVNAPQWTLAPAGVSIPPAGTDPADSAVVLWWCNGDQNSPGFTLAPGASITFLTYYGLNSEPLLTTPTVTQTINGSETMTYTRTITPSFTTTPTSSITQTPTITQSFTNSPTITQTPTITWTHTVTQTPSATPSSTVTCSITPTSTITFSWTVTQTATMTLSPTLTPTITVTSTVSPTPTITPTATPIPEGAVYAFPNPYSLSRGNVKFIGLPTGYMFTIYTLSGEHVRTLTAQGGINYWDGTNFSGAKVSPGIYLYVVKPYSDKNVICGKLFVIH